MKSEVRAKERDLEGTTVSIIGLGASGLAAALLAEHRGADVYVSEIRTDAETRARRDRLDTHGVAVDLGRHDIDRIARSALVVVSPGIPPNSDVLSALREQGVRWVSEPEFAVRYLPGPLISVTGTNGKTTTTVLIAHLLKAGGLDAAFGGNVGPTVGPPASGLALLDPAPDWTVLEMSSFQLADVRTFRPDIGVVTNLAPDHLDRYETVSAYFADKARLFDTATAASRWVLNGDDPAVLVLPADAPGARYRFSLREEPDQGAFIRDEYLVLRVDGVDEEVLSADQLPLVGAPGRANALAAALVARLSGVEVASIAAGLRSFRPLPDRLEPLGEEGGVLWVNDSKATNVAATSAALSSLGRPCVVLLGGTDKDEAFESLRQGLESGARAVVVYGAAADRMQTALQGLSVPVVRVEGSFEDAVHAGREMAQAGDALLLSPACSSFDMFRNFHERGERFREVAAEAGARWSGSGGAA